jgi:hypothetical protein
VDSLRRRTASFLLCIVCIFHVNLMLITHVLTKKMLVQHTVTYRWKKHVLSITQNLPSVIYIFSSTHVSIIILFYFCEEPAT